MCIRDRICTDNVTCGNSGGGNLVVSEEFIEQNQLKHFIVNSLGVVVSTVWSPNSKISSLSLVPGIYFHVIIDSNGQIESSPFIISSNY